MIFGLKFKLIAGVAILAALAIAVYSAHRIGFSKGKNLSQIAVSEYQRKIESKNAELAKAQAKKDVQIITKYVVQRGIAEKIVYRNRDVIRNIVSRPTNVTTGVTYALNQAAKGQEMDVNLVKSPETSTVNDAALTAAIAENYAIANRNAARHQALIDWHSK